MRYALRFAIVSAFLMARAASAQSTGDEPTNPFEQPGPDRVSASISDDDEQEPGFSFPKISLPKLKMPELKMPVLKLPKLPTRETRTSMTRTATSRSTAHTRPPNQPSTWEKFNQGTKSFFVKTRNTLLPWTVKEPVTSRPAARTASRDTARTSSNNRSFLPFLPKKEPEPQRIESANDFFKLPRPRFDE